MGNVVVTGMGLISPLGLSVEESWKNAIVGRSGIGHITRYPKEKYVTQIAGEVKGFDAKKYFEAKEVNRWDLCIQYGIGAGLDAIADANFKITPDNAERVGIIIGSGIGGLIGISETTLKLHENGQRHVTPFFIPSVIINMISGLLAIRTGAKGINYGVVSACATSNHAIADGFHAINRGEVDAVIVGGAEASITEIGVAGFCSARAMSKRNDEPEKASRPFDKDRDGFVLGEGAGAFVLESEEHAKKRGAKIYAKILGVGMTADAFHFTAPPEDGDGAMRAMKLAVQYSGLKPDDIDYINAHGTSTGLGDIAETIAIKRLFGEHSKKIMVSSTKSMHGHLLGGAGAIEAVMTILALKEGIIPPTINLDNPDPQCDLDYVPNVARKKEITYALSNGFGFGGTNASICFGKV
ncbi:MAG: beta-ketoacyl-ACP synthase II [Ignavibacteriales bacterium]|nr:beta-ketoacyl-ACP synthase II [Ignavibacteriales bacterium]